MFTIVILNEKYGTKSKMFIFFCVKLKLKMFTKTYTKIKSYLTSIIIRKIQNIAIEQRI